MLHERLRRAKGMILVSAVGCNVRNTNLTTRQYYTELHILPQASTHLTSAH
jgi:hypothetical protein